MSSPVGRLKKTWAVNNFNFAYLYFKLVPTEISSKFESEYMELFSRNYKALRDAVKQSTPPCLPYL